MTWGEEIRQVALDRALHLSERAVERGLRIDEPVPKRQDFVAPGHELRARAIDLAPGRCDAAKSGSGRSGASRLLFRLLPHWSERFDAIERLAQTGEMGVERRVRLLQALQQAGELQLHLLEARDAGSGGEGGGGELDERSSVLLQALELAADLLERLAQSLPGKHGLELRGHGLGLLLHVLQRDRLDLGRLERRLLRRRLLGERGRGNPERSREQGRDARTPDEAGETHAG